MYDWSKVPRMPSYPTRREFREMMGIKLSMPDPPPFSLKPLPINPATIPRRGDSLSVYLARHSLAEARTLDEMMRASSELNEAIDSQKEEKK